MTRLTVPDVTGKDTLAAALAYAAAGWYVGPLVNGEKNPGSRLGKGWQTKTSRDPETIVAWFAGSDDGVFLHCGRSGAIVCDVDHPERIEGVLLKAIGDTQPPHQSTRTNQPGRGHYLFTQPDGTTLGNGLGKLPTGWGELRGLNGVIVAEPTIHEKATDGGQYRWVRTGQVPTLPPSVTELLNEARPGEDAATDTEVRAFLDQHTTSSRPDLLDALAATFEKKVAEGASRHDAAVSVCAGAMAEARAGFYPARDAMDRLEHAFLTAITQPGHGAHQGAARSPAMATSEWMGISAWAIAQANAANLDEVRNRAADKVPDPNWFQQPADPLPDNVDPDTGEITITLDECHAVFRRWLGDDYDTDALDAMICAAACDQLDGDPLWLLLISGSGNAKTETVQALAGVGAEIISTISSDAALLSGTPKFERSKKATGGLLRKLGSRGLLVIKDVTSILSASREDRGRILAALREIHDGRWTRDVGTEGGLTLLWEGRVIVIGAVTTAWDQAHDVIATMGDRFVLIRMDSSASTGRVAAGRKAIRNTGTETTMRAELAAAVAGVLAGLDHDKDRTLTDAETDRLLAAADLVTLARTAVIFDYRGDVVDAHAPEMPTRFAKQLAQMVRSGIALEMNREKSIDLAIRCARDSVPPLRLAIIDDLATNAHSTPSEIRRRIDKPRATVDRQCQALHMLGVLSCDEVAYGEQGRTRWYYSLAEGIAPETIHSVDNSEPVDNSASGPKSSPVKSLNTPNPLQREGQNEASVDTPLPVSDLTGEHPPQVNGQTAPQPDPVPAIWDEKWPEGTVGAEVNS